ncbi:hypothetical protein FDA52_16415 [Clostridium botulinum]|uniref:hypothetical protein n=1 Tax=Clostridium botulinum TaxID=1491 RepID=UPI000772F06E|nr:hypothetical protein [Clostridium botulinum]NFE96244.1 hypothetical protein [Clostridium botulinum]NFI54500.1 hypothetical protein [Clostridium botulinum]NFL39790.1 hypothetical protein [Clostridium botulinum]NFL66658.1 hypothetical protein [Clostridium botulinum]NFN09642.1 hypothetical protein [Clostridium botulinum]
MKLKLTKKLLTLGVSAMILSCTSVSAFASNSAGFSGSASKGNPVTSAPWGRATTTANYDTDSIGAKISVWTDGSLTDTDTTDHTWRHVAQTSKVYGGHYKAAGTAFEADYYGTDFDSSPTSWSDSDSWSY